MKRAQRFLVVASCAGLGLASSGCEYMRMLRPSVLKQLNPDVVRLVNEFPEVDEPNKEVVARLFAHGGLGHAEKSAAGVYRARIRVPEGQYIWQPAIIVMEQGGELEIEFTNEDSFSHHAAFIQSNGGHMSVMLPIHEAGRVRVQFDGPGLYWFGCPVSNHVLRGMLGMILVGGEVPAEAKLDRPPQSRDIMIPIKSRVDEPISTRSDQAGQ